METGTEKKNRHSLLHGLAAGVILCCSILLILTLTAASCEQEDSLPANAQQTDTKKETKKTATVADANKDGILDVPYLSQAGILPTGCELVSATMILQFYGYDLDAQTFAKTYVKMASLELDSKGLLVGPSPNDAFIGSPWDGESFGCYAPVVVKAMNKVTGNDYTAKNTTGTSLDKLVSRYIKKGTPALVWVSIGMSPTYSTHSWQLKDSGELFTWIANEHCMVLVGSDQKGYYLMDPYGDNGLVYYEKSVVQQRYEELGKQSVVLV